MVVELSFARLVPSLLVINQATAIARIEQSHHKGSLLGTVYGVRTDMICGPPRTSDGGRQPQSNIELMSKKQILDLKPAPRLEQVCDKRSKQMEHGKHRGG